MTDALRYAEKFENAAGTVSYTFPGDNLEYQASQGYRVTERAVIGADYAYDFAGGEGWAKEVGEESIRFTIWETSAAAVEAEFLELSQKVRSIGRGKLWTVDAAGDRRWAWAKLAARPSYLVNEDQFFDMPVELSFRRFSDWYAEALTSGSTTATSSPHDFSITNAGNAKARDLVVRLRSNTAAGFTDPVLLNQTNGQQVSTTRDASSANDELRIDNLRARVQRSTDDGATYADDWTLVTLPATQVALLELEPGLNSLRLTSGGSPNVTVEWEFHAAYE